jgi:fructuronate reductase
MTAAKLQRLRANTLADAHATTVPAYDRSAPPGIAHVGFGAFARAHLAVYADELLRRGQPALISGVSVRSRRAEDELEPQDGLFTVATREPGEDMSLQVVGALATMETGPAAALDALTAPGIKLVTLTITEKGYEAADPPTLPEAPASAPALIALSLAQRRRLGLAPPVFASLDNLLDNGSVLQARVLEAAETIDPSLAPWIDQNVLFPSSVVDRMVPAPTERDLEDIADRLGLIDRAAVGAEQHRSWIIRSVDGLAPWPTWAWNLSRTWSLSSDASSGF